MTTLSHWAVLERLLAAAVLGSLIGFERERLLWTAGIRTHMLVCVGACLIMIVSAYGFADSAQGGHVALDPSRMAAQVVSGIGFLGAGAILTRGEIVRGLTTAASIWAVAAIGLAAGGGLYFAAAASTVLILAILAGVKPLEEAYRARSQGRRIVAEAAHGVLTPEVVQAALKVRPAQIRRFWVKVREGGAVDDVTIILGRVSTVEAALLPARLGGIAGVSRVVVAPRRKGADRPTD